MVEKFREMFGGTEPELGSRGVVRWVADNFIKCHEEAEYHWLKFLSQEKVECSIRGMLMEREIAGLRQVEGRGRELNLRDFTGCLSTLFKANLRGRNVYQIFLKFKDISYIGRFIELLEEKACRGQGVKRTNKK